MTSRQRSGSWLRVLPVVAVALGCLTAVGRGDQSDQSEDFGSLRPLAEVLSERWATHSSWDAHSRELARYRAERVESGIPRPYEHLIETRIEVLHREQMVPAVPPFGDKPLVEVVTQIQRATVEVADEPHHIQTRLSVRRNRPVEALRLSVSVQEPIGPRFSEFALNRTPPVMQHGSQREGSPPGRRSLALHGPESHFEEELFALVRSLSFQEGLRARLFLYPSQSGASGLEPMAVPALLTVQPAPEGYSSRAGLWQAEAIWEVRVETDDGRDLLFLVEREHPHTLLLFEHSDGRRYALEKREELP